MRVALPVGLLFGALMTACSGCGGSEQKAAAPPAPAPALSATQVGTITDGDDDGTESGNEGDDGAPLPAGPAVTASAKLGSAALLAEADRQLAAMSSTVYSHHTMVDEGRGSFEYDCSGFVDYSLSRATPDAFADLRNGTVKRPLAKHFVSFASAIPAAGRSGRWHRVMRATDLVPGDIVAWLKPADSTSKNTGHVMIVHGAPSRLPAHADSIVVPIIDSTAMRHGAGDSRAVRASGLGTGSIVLVVDGTGAPVHFNWTRGKSREHTSSIALAHLE